MNSRDAALCLLGLFLPLSQSVQACDLCAIYSADNARGGTSAGFQFTVSEQYISYRTTQLDGTTLDLPDPEHVEESTTHLVPSYNFSRSFGVSLNVPYVTKSYFRYGVLADERGTSEGVGDASLIARYQIFSKAQMEWGVNLNVLGGVKFPTGNTDFLRAEADESRLYTQLFGPNHPHGVIPLVGGVHYHMLTVGSGSFDGIFGLNFNSRWRRLFFTSQAQYYLRTEGEETFEFGDMLMLSGGPGAYLLSNNKCTLNLQLNAVYVTETRARLFGEESDQTGGSAFYVGPQLGLTLGKHFTTVGGVDIPLDIRTSGLQVVPDYRLHASIGWRF